MTDPTALRLKRGVRVVALLEAVKGGLALLAALGLLWTIHEGAARVVDELARHLHLNPAKEAPGILARLARGLTDARLWLIAAGAVAYVLTRAVEAYGLWRERRWAQWFSVVSGAIYLPFELYEIGQGYSTLKLVTLLANLGIVAIMARSLRQSR